ncbi:MAG: hypothetical protein GX282_02425 [Campylobacteraceae bacterium]|nr:hypothetical protein [Campylobacteraceae bacterium]
MRVWFLILSLFLTLSANECRNCENLGEIKKVYASNPVLMYQMYAIDKSRVAGLVFEFWDIEKEYLDSNFTSLPVVGGFYGQGRTPNIEQVLALKPDLIITSTLTTGQYKEVFDKANPNSLYRCSDFGGEFKLI